MILSPGAVKAVGYRNELPRSVDDETPGDGQPTKLLEQQRLDQEEHDHGVRCDRTPQPVHPEPSGETERLDADLLQVLLHHDVGDAGHPGVHGERGRDHASEVHQNEGVLSAEADRIADQHLGQHNASHDIVEEIGHRLAAGPGDQAHRHGCREERHRNYGTHQDAGLFDHAHDLQACHHDGQEDDGQRCRHVVPVQLPGLGQQLVLGGVVPPGHQQTLNRHHCRHSDKHRTVRQVEVGLDRLVNGHTDHEHDHRPHARLGMAPVDVDLELANGGVA